MHKKKTTLFIFIVLNSLFTFAQNNLPDWEVSHFEPYHAIIMNDTIHLVPVDSGTFLMGSKFGNDDNKPIHSVTVSRFYMSDSEVTFDLYDSYCKATGKKLPYDGDFGRGKLPVINVSWYQAMEFCKWLTLQTGMNFRLPTEAEWEFAARGGNKTHNYEYAGSDDQEKVSWYTLNSNDFPHPVKRKAPNELGIYDLSGNVWEWCLDGKRKYTEEPQINPKGEINKKKDYRVSRGGSWGFYPQFCRVYFRDNYLATEQYSDLGIRLVAEPTTKRPVISKLKGIY